MGKLKSSKSFDKDIGNLPPNIKKLLEKQLGFLMDDPFHPSLKTEKIDKKRGIWAARVNIKYRFTFTMVGDVYFLRRVGDHDKVLKNC